MGMGQRYYYFLSFCGVRFPYFVPKNATWDDPRLLSECTEYGKKLKVNPFVVDNREKERNKTNEIFSDKRNAKAGLNKKIIYPKCKYCEYTGRT